MFRKRLSKRKSRRMFKKGARRIKSRNRVKAKRGGYRI